tara:strand:- start:59 stop:1249 length:1191 start_codon:yes stop_codon:yes gene_type:complete
MSRAPRKGSTNVGGDPQTIIDNRADNSTRTSDGNRMAFPSNLGSHCTLLRFFDYKYGGVDGGTVSSSIADIILPLPKQIQDSFKINIAGDELGIIGNATAQVAGDPNASLAIAGQLGKAAVQAASNIASGAMGAMTGDTAKIAEAVGKGTDAATYLSRSLLTKITPDIASGIGAGRGNALNPFATLVFKGVDLKVHSLEWLLSPDTEAESVSLKKIIKKLQMMVLPTTASPLGDDAVTGLSALDRGLLKYPSMVDIYLQGIDSEYYMQFKTAMVSQISVDYTPNGLAVNKKGRPSAIRLTMTLQEAFIHTSDDHKLDADGNPIAIPIDPPPNVDLDDIRLTGDSTAEVIAAAAADDTFTNAGGTTLSQADITKEFPDLNTVEKITADARFTKVPGS